jgi:hypothetical protein
MYGGESTADDDGGAKNESVFETHGFVLRATHVESTAARDRFIAARPGSRENRWAKAADDSGSSAALLEARDDDAESIASDHRLRIARGRFIVSRGRFPSFGFVLEKSG